MKNSTINIVLRFIFARAYARIKQETFLPKTAVVLSALVLSGCATMPTATVSSNAIKTNAAAKSAPVQFVKLDTLNEISSIQVKRLNERNGASETLTVAGVDATVERSTGFSKSLSIGDQPLKILSQKIMSLKKAPAGGAKNADGVRIYFTITGQSEVKNFEMDPAAKMMPVYADLMNIRNQVLADGK